LVFSAQHPAVRFRISDPNDPEVYAEGHVFAIVGGLSLLTPQGGEMWTVGSRRKVAWQAYGTLPNVALEYASLDGFSQKELREGTASIHADLDWKMIDPTIPNIGSYIWEVPDALGEKTILRVSDSRDPFSLVDDIAKELAIDERKAESRSIDIRTHTPLSIQGVGSRD